MNITSMTIDEIKKQYGVGKTGAYKMRREALAESQPEASESLTEEIFRVLKEHGPQDGVAELTQHLSGHPSASQVSASIWSLQKRDLVTFYERKAGNDSVLHKIKISRNGLREAGVEPKHRGHGGSHRSLNGELKGRSPVGVDPTDYRNQPYTAKGGPIERIHTPERREPEIVPSVPYEPPTDKPAARYSSPEPLPSNMKPETHPTEMVLTSLGGYPMIRSLLERSHQADAYIGAAKLLESVDEEAALELLGKVAFEDLEKEIIAFVKHLRRAIGIMPEA